MRVFAALLISTAPLLALPAIAAPAPKAEPTMPGEARGVVLDATTNRPLGGVFVQQEGGLASAFTGAEGAFALTLDHGAQPRLTFTSNGFEPLTVPVGTGKDLKVSLKPISVLVPGAAPLAPVKDAVDNEPILPLDSRVSFAYRLRNETVSSDTASLSGWANNDFALALRYRWSHWLFDAEGAHVQMPVDVNGLPRELNPAFSPSTYEATAKVSYLLPLRNNWESAFGVGYRYKDTVPNNHGTPYIGNPADFEQTRHALGVTGTLGWTSPRSPWGFEGTLAAYPAVYAWAKDPGAPYANQLGIEAGAGLSYEITHGLRLGLGYKFEGWRGNGDDTVHLIQAQVHYTPVGIFKGSDR